MGSIQFVKITDELLTTPLCRNWVNCFRIKLHFK